MNCEPLKAVMVFEPPEGGYPWNIFIWSILRSFCSCLLM